MWGEEFGSTWAPEVCKIMAFYGCYYGFRAIILHTFGVQVGTEIGGQALRSRDVWCRA